MRVVTNKVLNIDHATLGVAGSTLPITPASATNIKQYIDLQIAVTSGFVIQDLYPLIDGVQTVFAITTPNLVINSEQVYIDGLCQVPNIAYTVSTTQLTMTFPPNPSNVDTFFIRYISTAP